MKKIIFVALLLLLIGCSNSARNEPAEAGHNLPGEWRIESGDIQKITNPSDVIWPSEWKEVLHNGMHSCTINATVEMDEEPRKTYLVYRELLSEEYIRHVKDLFLREGKDPRGENAPENALVEFFHKDYLLLQWGGPEPVSQPERWVLDGEAAPDEEGHALNNVTLSQAEAQAKADSFLEKIDLIENLTLIHAEKARIIDSPSHNTLCEGWEFIYSLKVPGCIPIYFSDKQLHGQMSIPLHKQAPFGLTEVIVMVTEDGVMEFCYFNPVRVELGRSVENELLTFDSVQRRFRKCFDQGLQSMTFDETVFDPDVQRFVLSYALCPVQNAAGELRPVWIALFTTEYESNLPSNPLSYVCIDAVTGEVLNPVQ